MNTLNQQDYIEILSTELQTAMGCTEPAAIAYAAAITRKTLGAFPEQMEIQVSNNIIKNAKSAVIPNTNGLKGIKAAAAAGVIAGDPDAKLEVISSLDDNNRIAIRSFLASVPIHIFPANNHEKLDIIIKAFHGNDTALVRIARTHTNIVKIVKNNQILYNHPLGDVSSVKNSIEEKKSRLTVDGILNFAENIDLSLIQPLLIRQIHYNSDIAIEGLSHPWGAQIGRTILKKDSSIQAKAAAYAAAGSDARMSGCKLPVVINSGSGNQGITVSLPVIVFAKEQKLPDEQLYRALLISNLIAIHIKNGIGSLSAFCGAVSAGCGAGCGISWLLCKNHTVLYDTLTNTLATTSGIICDGAKPSCAAKIALSVQNALMGLEMAKSGQCFKCGDGVVGENIESTIQNIALIGSEGMNATDDTIVQIMCK